MTRHCPNCDTELDDGTYFCPKCGHDCREREEWICKKCNVKNPATADFCKKCGNSFQSQESKEHSIIGKIKSWSKQKVVRYGLIGLIILIASFSGAYYYYNYMSETHYLLQYAEASKKIADANDTLLKETSPDLLKNDKRDDIQKQLQDKKSDIDDIEERISKTHPLEKYETQQKNLISLLQKESNVLDQTNLAIKKPLSSETDNVIANIKDDIDSIVSLSTQIEVPNTTFALTNNFPVLPHQLTLFVEEERQVNKAKLERLTAMNDFFQKMDSIIQRYDSEKTDFGNLLVTLRNGGYTWLDYFRLLQQAKTMRVGLRNQVNYLKEPQGTEDVKRQLIDVLTQSIQYCDTMHAGANLEFRRNYSGAQTNYTKAKTINESVQDAYTQFTSNYQVTKSQLTNVDNL
jgi:hypothetical protein